MNANPRRSVGSRLVLQAHQPLEMVLQVAVSGMPGTRVEEDLVIASDGEPVKAAEVAMAGGGRAHTLTVDPGRVEIGYSATVHSTVDAPDVTDADRFAYAPGLQPMDFHAVAEALVGGAWHVVDATLLAPRSTLVRIATGRDAADTAFLSTYGGAAELIETEITAVADGPLPSDDVTALVTIG